MHLRIITLFILFSLLFVCIIPCGAEEETMEATLTFKPLRFEEDYSSSKNSLKFIPLNENKDMYLSVGGSIRERIETFDYYKWGQGPQTSTPYLLQRYTLHSDYHLNSEFRAFVELKSGLENGRKGGPRPVDEDQLDLSQGFAEWSHQIQENEKITLRIGRQEFRFGSARLIANRDEANVQRSLDAADFIMNLEHWRIDSFFGKLDQTNVGIFDDSFDPNTVLWGVYSAGPFLPNGGIDLYYLGLMRNQIKFVRGAGNETRHSVGTRVWGNSKPLDYDFEFSYQFGTFGLGTIQAWELASDTGYTFEEVPLYPRLSLKTSMASGDHDPTQTKLQTFDPIFPKGCYFDQMDLIGPSNILSVDPTLTLKLSKEFILKGDWNWMWLDDVHDGLYNNALTIMAKSKSASPNDVGNSMSGKLIWKLNPHLSFNLVYVHFTPGTFLQNSNLTENIHYGALTGAYKF